MLFSIYVIRAPHAYEGTDLTAADATVSDAAATLTVGVVMADVSVHNAKALVDS
jgi:hypothetical protein